MADVPRDAQGTPLLEGTVDVMLLRVEGEPVNPGNPGEPGGGGERRVAIAFSTVVGLVEAMGEEQPWVAIPTAELETALRGSGAQAVLLDPRLPDGAGAPDRD
ncbi:SAV_915 family protein [Streptomyces sp. NPDC005921]|uniref:SAV_915 family protein n=1 Tax=Streptomyces sp. NPDC005827 TaxID=3157070 RepID=UPI0033D2E2E0